MGKPDVRKWLSLALQFMPVVLAASGVPAAIIGPIVDGVTAAEQIPGASGADKKAHVMEIARDTIDSVNGAAGKQVIDPKRVPALVSDGIDLGVRVVETVHDHTTDAVNLNVPHPAVQPSDVPEGLLSAPNAAASTVEILDTPVDSAAVDDTSAATDKAARGSKKPSKK